MCRTAGRVRSFLPLDALASSGLFAAEHAALIRHADETPES
jgi:hypothetical protein